MQLLASILDSVPSKDWSKSWAAIYDTNLDGIL